MRFATRQLKKPFATSKSVFRIILWVPELIKPERERDNNECLRWDDSYEALKCTPLLPPVITT